MYTGFILLFLVLVARRKVRALLVTVVSSVWALGLSAFKLVPALFWMSGVHQGAYTQSSYTWRYLGKIFLGRNWHGANVFYNQGIGWHEYGAYVGPVIVVLAIVALLGWRRDRITRLLVIGVVITITVSTLGPLAGAALAKLEFLPRSNVSRLVLVGVIPLALLAGKGLDVLGSRRWLWWIPAAMIGLAAIDLFTLSYPVSTQAFTMDAVREKMPVLVNPIAYSRARYPEGRGGREYTRFSALVEQGYGWLDYCPPLNPSPAVVSAEANAKAQFAEIKGGGEARVSGWSPNGFDVDYRAEEESIVVFNENFGFGWTVNGAPALNDKGRLAAKVPAGEGQIKMRYRARGIGVGIAIVIATVGLVIGLMTSKRRFR
ncbi:MAG: hypothetical protein U1C49_02455 [Candidatus Andersenbacteria bacterium]|nr:hypothetical protein [bacterium]MDZ4225689.1 hypothetical protein [Candidatus Andersenbacteria bacterium]